MEKIQALETSELETAGWDFDTTYEEDETGGGVSQEEFDEAIERLDQKNEEQDEEITSIRQEIAGVEAIQDETIEMIGDGD